MYVTAFALGLFTAMGWMSGVKIFKTLENTPVSAVEQNVDRHKYTHEKDISGPAAGSPGGLR